MPRIIELEETASTNSDAKELADRGAEHLTVVAARRQTAGRGRHGRSWHGGEGDVFWSVVLRPGRPWGPPGQLVYVHALAVLDAVRQETGGKGEFSLKWPNDLLLRGRKVAGSLLEAKTSAAGPPEWMVAGTGINVANRPPDDAVLYPATSLHREGLRSATREGLWTALLQAIESGIERWVRDGFEPVRDRYWSELGHRDRTVRVGTSPDRASYCEGIARGLDADGALVVEQADGTRLLLHCGDILLCQ